MGISLRNVVLDTTDVPRLAEFYRDLLGWSFPDGYDPDDPDWRTLVAPDGFRLGFQRADALAPTTWPDPAVPQQLHLDVVVPDLDEAEVRERLRTRKGRCACSPTLRATPSASSHGPGSDRAPRMRTGDGDGTGED